MIRTSVIANPIVYLLMTLVGVALFLGIMLSIADYGDKRRRDEDGKAY
jgi:hypothetical protein